MANLPRTGSRRFSSRTSQATNPVQQNPKLVLAPRQKRRKLWGGLPGLTVGFGAEIQPNNLTDTSSIYHIAQVKKKLAGCLRSSLGHGKRNLDFWDK